MRELAGKTAFVTGGASGIGLALGRAFAEAGMNVMLADIETGVLDAAVSSLNGFGSKVRSVACDVADPESVERAAGQPLIHSARFTWSATMPALLPLGASTQSHLITGDGFST